MRGRLINPFSVEIAQLDTAATEDDPDDAGPLTSGYDPDFKEAVVFTAAGVRTSARKEKDLIRLPAQVETNSFEQLQMIANGDSPTSAVVLVFHFRDLERLGMVDASGNATIRKGDRLHAIYRRDGVLVQTIRNPPGLFVVQPLPSSFGLGMHRNLLLAMFESREQGAR